MNTGCSSQRLHFGELGRREILAEFSGGSLSSDGRALFLRLAEAKTGIVKTFVQRAMRDHRHQGYVEHLPAYVQTLLSPLLSPLQPDAGGGPV